MKFDIIIMNPPYNKNLHLKILEKAIDVVDFNSGSEIINLSPIRWLQDPLASYKNKSDLVKFKKILNFLEKVEKIDASVATQSFNAGFWADLGIYKLSKNKKYVLPEVPSFIKKVIIPIKENKLNPCSDFLSKQGKGNFSKPFIKVSVLHGHPGKKDFYDFTSPDIKYAKKIDGGSCAVTFNFNTEKESFNFFNYLQLDFVKYINVLCKTDLNVPWNLLPWLGNVKWISKSGKKFDGYKQKWVDKDLYEYFNLSQKEINEIEKTMKNYT